MIGQILETKITVGIHTDNSSDSQCELWATSQMFTDKEYRKSDRV